MTTEARDALAAALHKTPHHARGGADDDLARTGCMQFGMEHSHCYAKAGAILAALDGWTLVPVDTVAVIEALAVIEHEQWIAWASTIAMNESISPERLARWEKAMVPYADLPDDVKEQDREWARKALRAALGASDDE